MSEIESPYFVEILRGVEETLDNAGLSMVLTTTHDEARRHRRWMARVVEHGTEGVVLVLPDEHAAPLEELRRRGIPFAVVDQEERGNLCRLRRRMESVLLLGLKT